jgi:hypothetical protein
MMDECILSHIACHEANFKKVTVKWKLEKINSKSSNPSKMMDENIGTE